MRDVEKEDAISLQFCELSHRQSSDRWLLKIARPIPLTKKKAGALLALISLIVGIFPLAVATPTPAARLKDGRPTLAELKSYIAKSVMIDKVPNLSKTIPPLQSMRSWDTHIDPLSTSCFLQNGIVTPATHPETSCVWGDPKGKQSIFLLGDSLSSMWLPALNQLGKDLGWKIYYLGAPGCPPWPYPYSVRENGSSGVTCNNLVRSEVKFILRVHPTIVMPVGFSLDWGVGKYANVAQNVGQIQDWLKQIAPSHSRVVLLGPIPQYMMSPYYFGHFALLNPDKCLTQTNIPLHSCLEPPSDAMGAIVARSLKAIAQKDKIPFIDTTPLFCTKKICALFVKAPSGVHLVYYDYDHMNRYYSVWISRAFEILLQPTLRSISGD